MGVVNPPLNDTVSLPLGAGEVKAIDMAAANAVLANGGLSATPWAAIEVRNSQDQVIYRHDTDAPAPTRVVEAVHVAALNNMMKEVVNAGTARAAQLPGVQAAGKTGTTNAYKDAWYNGYTGNFVGTVWYGNDDSTPTRNMTGGSLPARTWKAVMEYAHSGIELKNPYGVQSAPTPAAVIASSTAGRGELGPAQRPALLSRRSFEALGGIEDMMRSTATRQRGAEIKGPGTQYAEGLGAPSPVETLGGSRAR
jgi:penicillin-binding protein 1A